MDAELRQLAAMARAAAPADAHRPHNKQKKKKSTKKKKKNKKQKQTLGRETDGKRKRDGDADGGAGDGGADYPAGHSALTGENTSKPPSKKTTANERKRRKKATRAAAAAAHGDAAAGAAPPPPPAAAPAPKRVYFGERETTTDKYADSDDDDDSASGNATEESSSSSARTTAPGLLGQSNAESALWYDNCPPPLVDGPYKAKISFDAGKALEGRAQELWDAEIEAYQARKAGRKSSSDSKWLRTVMRNGTLSDRVAAMSMVVQESVLHNFETLAALVAMTRKRGSREAHLAIEAIRDLFANQLLPDRKLRLFHNNPLDHKGATDAHLIYWRFEAALSEKFSEYVQAMEEGAQESLPYFKRACIQAAHELLAAKPEKEKRLLSLLVNKLGDPDRKIGANVVFLLQQLIRKHPGMKGVVVDELEALIFRDGVSQRAQYYALVFMTEIPLARQTDTQLAKRMIALYIRMFTAVADEERARKLAAKGGGKKGDGSKGRRVGKKARWGENGAPKNNHRRKLKNKRKMKNRAGHAGDNVGNAQTKLMRALLQGINRAFAYADCEGHETEEMTDTLFRMVHHAPFATGVQALMLLLHVMVARSALSARFYRTLYSKLFDDQLRSASKHTMFLNVVYKSMKMDTEPSRVRAFAKRLLQTCLSMGASFTCGVLFLLSEVAKAQPELKAAIAGAREEAHPAAEEEEEEEDRRRNGGTRGDADEDGDGNRSRGRSATQYDPTKRDPLHARAEYCRLWELTALSDHFHPSVREFTKSLLTAPHKIAYSGDPLLDFSTAAFLERFSYRNPRQKDLTAISRRSGTGGGSSTMRPIAAGKFGRTSVANPVNSKDFAQQNRASVRPEEVFFHDFFRSREQRDRRLGIDARKKKKKKGGKEDDGGEDEDAEFDMVPGSGRFSDDDDEEAEAFAQQLAEGIMEEAAGVPADPDGDEDPVFDWSDDDDDDDGGGDEDDALMMAGGASSDEDEDDAMFGEEEEDSDDGVGSGGGGGGGGRRGKGGKAGGAAGIAHETFASAEEFADILESSGNKGNKHQKAWERRNDWMQRGGKRAKKFRGRR